MSQERQSQTGIENHLSLSSILKLTAIATIAGVVIALVKADDIRNQVPDNLPNNKPVVKREAESPYLNRTIIGHGPFIYGEEYIHIREHVKEGGRSVYSITAYGQELTPSDILPVVSTRIGENRILKATMYDWWVEENGKRVKSKELQ